MALHVGDEGEVAALRQIVDAPPSNADRLSQQWSISPDHPQVYVMPGTTPDPSLLWANRFKAMVVQGDLEFTEAVDSIPTEATRRELAVKLAESILMDLKASFEQDPGDPVWHADGNSLQEALRPSYLMWMCETVIAKKDEWVATRLHRWIGYIQAGLLLSGITGLEHEKDRVRDLKKEFPED